MTDIVCSECRQSIKQGAGLEDHPDTAWCPKCHKETKVSKRKTAANAAA